MPYRKRRKQTSPLFFVLLALLVVLLPTAFVLAGSLPAAPVLAEPAPSAESGSSAVSSAPTAPQPEPEPAPSEAAPPPSVQPQFTLNEADAKRITDIIEADKRKAAAYIPPPESTEPAGEGESAPVSSSQLSHFERPELYGQQVSVYFKDLTSGAEYSYDPDRKYFIASLIKAPYAMYVYQLASEGKCDLNQLVAVTGKDIMEGTGTLQKLPAAELPKDFTLQELLTLAIVESDNTAMKAMLRLFEPKDYLDYAKGLGIHYPEDVRYVTNGRITARDAAVYMDALQKFFAENEYGPLLREDMLHTRNVMIRSKFPTVRKYGWASLSFHDMALVEAKHPYVLIILTDKDIGRQDDYKLFSTLTAEFERILNEKYGA